MKYIFIILFFSNFYLFAQDSDSKSAQISIEVSGVCEMCKSRIEKGAIKLKGVKYANWDINSNKLSIIYNSRKIKLDSIKYNMALLGHDTDKYKSTDKVYNNLPECCYYKTTSSH